jgi:hypothetical protein
LNSDLRFFDTPWIWQQNIPGVTTPLVQNQPLVLTDDGGGEVQIQIFAPTGSTSTGNVRVIPISGSLGVSIGRIEVDLSGGARLQLTGLGPAGSNKVISIGRIVITNADANSSIGVDGNTQVDIWNIQQLGGDGFLSVTNTSPFGDIVAIDTVALNSIDIRTGDLGRTQVPAWGAAAHRPVPWYCARQRGRCGRSDRCPGRGHDRVLEREPVSPGQQFKREHAALFLD